MRNENIKTLKNANTEEMERGNEMKKLNNYIIYKYDDDGDEVDKVIYYNDDRTAWDLVCLNVEGDVYNMLGHYESYEPNGEEDDEGNELLTHYTIIVKTSPAKDYDLYDIYDRYVLGDYVDEDDYINYRDDDVISMIEGYTLDELTAEMSGDHYYKNDPEFMNLFNYYLGFLD